MEFYIIHLQPPSPVGIDGFQTCFDPQFIVFGAVTCWSLLFSHFRLSIVLQVAHPTCKPQVFSYIHVGFFFFL